MKKLLALLMLLVHVAAFADFTPLPILEGEVGQRIDYNKRSYFDNMGACKAWVSGLISEPAYWEDCSAVYKGTGLCENYRAKEDDFPLGSCLEKSFCPDNARTHIRRDEKDKIITTCTCFGGYVEKDHACVKPKTCEAGKEIHRDFPVKGPSQLCDGGCMYKLEASVDAGEYGWGGDYVGTGAECSEKPDKPDKPDEPKPDPNPGDGGSGGGGGSGSGGGSGDGKPGGKPGGKPDGKPDGNGECEGNDCADNNAGPGLPGTPDLYKKQYKDGIKGVWSERSAEMKKTPLGGLAGRLLPKVNSGTCPKWMVDLNFGGRWNYGTGDVSPPCWIWPVLRAMVICCALIFASRLIFGGA